MFRRTLKYFTRRPATSQNAVLKLTLCLIVGIFLLNFQNEAVAPTVFIAMIVRNRYHTLPYSLTLLEKLDYPKERISIWIGSGQNEDNSTKILRTWTQEMQTLGKYHSVSLKIDNTQMDKNSLLNLTSKEYQLTINLKNEAIKVAQKIGADFIFFLDAETFLLNNQTLKKLVSKQKDLVAPLLLTSASGGGLFGNFWGYTKDYYYERTDDYLDILNGKKKGCFPVPLIHSAVLMNIRRKNFPDFSLLNSSVPEDDFIQFAVNAQAKNKSMEICNDVEYGIVISPFEETVWYSDYFRSQNLHVEISSYWPDLALPVSDLLQQFVPDLKKYPKSTLGFEKIFVINLKKRPDKLRTMDRVMDILRIDYTLIEAVDGMELTSETIDKMGIRIPKGYQDPYVERRMTFGEIGCFLSHYKIWELMVKNNITKALIFEDDVRYEPYFVFSLQRVFKETANLNLDWDLIYLGRESIYSNPSEPFVNGSRYLVHVDYSYGAYGYALSLKGAKKLIDAKPLEKLVPVDNLFAIMYDKHPNATWKTVYPKRNLKAFSGQPLLLYHNLAKIDPGHSSDTEYSPEFPQKPR